MALVANIPPVPAKKPSETPQPGAKHFDIILGFDFHFLKVPWPMTPCPVTPFAAIIFDPMDYIHITLPAMPVYSSEKGFSIAKNVPMGGTVTINGCYRAAATSGLMALPPMIPIGPMLKKVGFKVKPPNPLHFVIPKAIILINPLAPHDGQISHGSKTVFTAQSEQSALMCNVWSCNELGQIVMNNPMGLFANYATKIIAVLPFGKPVMIGGPFIEHQFKIDDLINALMMAGIMKGAAAILGRILNALVKKLNKFLDAHPNIRAAIQPVICRTLGEPVDVASGHMTSLFQGFSLPGPIPFKWEANYYSDGKYDGPLGKNVYHSYDISLFIDKTEELVVMKDTAGRAVPFPTLQRGHSFFNPMEKFELHRSLEGEYYVSSKEGLFYYFTKEEDKERWRKLRSIVNRNGFAIRFSYNRQGHLEKIIDSSHRTIEVLNNDAGCITELRLQHPDVKWQECSMIRYSYDEEGRMRAFHDALNYSNKLEWKNRLIVSRQFNDGTVFTFSYDQEQRCYATLGPNGLYSYQFEYKDGLTIVENSLNFKSFYYHNKGIVTSILDSRGGEKIITYDVFNNLIGEQDAMGGVKSYIYDLRSNLTAITLPGQGTTKIEYNDLHLPKKTILPNGGIWQHEYDTEGNLLRKINPLGAATTYKYDNGSLSTITNASGSDTQLLYDKEYNLRQVTLPNQSTIHYAYDTHGRCIKITAPNGNNQVRKYDLGSNLIEVKEPDGNIRTMHYNGIGDIIEASDKHYNLQFSYNFFGDVISRTQGGASVYYKYNTEGQLTSLVNEHNEHYVFELDSEGNVITEIGFDGITRSYQHNLAGKVISVQRPEGRSTRYEYDTAGRLSLACYSDSSNEEFEYDAFGNLIRAKNKDTEVLLLRNLLGAVITEQQGKHVVTSKYDDSGNRTHIQSSMGADIHIHYDPLMGWAESIQANGWHAEIKRNKTGQETKRIFTGNLELTNSYDPIGRIKQQSILTNGKVNRNKEYTWDVNEQLKVVSDSHTGAKQFTHDVYGNLTEVIFSGQPTEYRIPDAVGNLFSSPTCKERMYGRDSRLLKNGNNVYEYDMEGNLVKKREKDYSEWKYIWNDKGNLQKVIRPDGQEVSFGYDALGRRIWKRYKSTITRWVWDGNVLLHEWKEFEARESSPDDLITWIFEEESFIPIGKTKGTRKFSIIADQLGTPFNIFDENGTKVWDGELDSYGKLRMFMGKSGSCPFRYQGQYEDSETGLYYNRFRYYSPEQGCFTSQDPIRLRSGILNLYFYVKDTNTFFDPLGLAQCHINGKLGVQLAEADIKNAGMTVIGREVTMTVNGSRVRADLVAIDAAGNIHVFEAKYGNSHLTPNQTSAGVYNMNNPSNSPGGGVNTSAGTSGNFTVATDNRPAVGARGAQKPATFHTVTYP